MSPLLQVVLGFCAVCVCLAAMSAIVPIVDKKQKRQIEKTQRKVEEIKREGEKSKQNTKIELERMINDKEAEVKALLEKAKGMMHRIASDTEQQHPWLAKEIADTENLIDKQLAQELRTKKNPAVKAADEITKISKEKRLLKEQNRLMEYQLDLYERNFPWLLDFKKLAPKEAEDYSNEENTILLKTSMAKTAAITARTQTGISISLSSTQNDLSVAYLKAGLFFGNVKMRRLLGYKSRR